MRRLEEYFPGNAEIAEMGLTTLRRAVERANSDGRFADARQLFAQAKPTLSPVDAESLTVSFFNVVAQTHFRSRNWFEAVDAYDAGGVDGVLATNILLQDFVDDARALDRIIESLLGREASVLLSSGYPDEALELIMRLQQQWLQTPRSTSRFTFMISSHDKLEKLETGLQPLLTTTLRLQNWATTALL